MLGLGHISASMYASRGVVPEPRQPVGKDGVKNKKPEQGKVK